MLCKMCDVRVCIGLVIFAAITFIAIIITIWILMHKRTTMDTVEKFSLLMLVLAYMIIVMLIVVYEITECRFSHLQQIFHTRNHSIH